MAFVVCMSVATTQRHDCQLVLADGGAVGGINFQIIDGVTGYLAHSPEGAAHRAIQLRADPDSRRRLGENGYELVKQNFLLTRHVKDGLLLMVRGARPRYRQSAELEREL